MSETKASSDPLWHAGCLEGYAACLSAMSDADHPTVHGDQALALLRDMAKDKGLEKAGQQEGSSTWTVLAEGVYCKVSVYFVFLGGGGQWALLCVCCCVVVIFSDLE